MTPKPLSAERRAEILRRDHGEDYRFDEIEDVFAAEAYWREAVKNVGLWADDWGATCHVCKACIQDGAIEDIPHETTCPWLLAQEERV